MSRHREMMEWLSKPLNDGYDHDEPQPTPSSLTESVRRLIHRDGFTAGRSGYSRECNTWTPGSETYRVFDEGWAEGDAERLAAQQAPALVGRRRDAKSQGLTRYYTGKPCKRGHLAERDVAGNCLECVREKRESEKTARREDPSRQAAQLARSKEKQLREAARAQGLTWYYGQPCDNGHNSARRYVSNGLCVECAAAAVRAQQPIRRWWAARV
jgi:hypothetical protein